LYKNRKETAQNEKQYIKQYKTTEYIKEKNKHKQQENKRKKNIKERKSSN